MFDRAEITVKAGDGGNGIVSFRREKFVPFGGPNGGDGGNGGDVVIRADSSASTLSAFRRGGLYRARDGEHGKGKGKHGRGGKGLVLAVPVGTVVWAKTQLESGALIADLAEPGQEIVAARGGKGGWGNTHFASSTNQAPRMAQKGEPGEQNSLVLELRLIADVGIIGYPNVGKSSLLAAASAARPQIADYPFTTREPVLGVVEVGRQTIVLAEIPGLIDGAHLGRGLGHDFLRHVVRTKILIHVLDGTSASPAEDMIRVNTELSLFDSALAQKPQVVAVNKIDLPEVRARLAEMAASLSAIGIKPLFISAAMKEGMAELMAETAGMLRSVASRAKAGTPVPKRVFRPQPRRTAARVYKEGDTFVVAAPELERIVVGPDAGSADMRWELQKQFARLGINKALEKAGIKPGDKVRCGDVEWEW